MDIWNRVSRAEISAQKYSERSILKGISDVKCLEDQGDLRDARVVWGAAGSGSGTLLRAPILPARHGEHGGCLGLEY
jgi:hypothetical protein